jgi:hypothetical protein
MWTRKASLVCQPQGSIERDPQHNRAVYKVLLLTTNFPYGHIFLFPDCAHVIGNFPNGQPMIVCDWLAKSVGEIYSVHQLAVYIQLYMPGCAVAYPDWLATPVTFKMW